MYASMYGMGLQTSALGREIILLIRGKSLVIVNIFRLFCWGLPVVWQSGRDSNSTSSKENPGALFLYISVLGVLCVCVCFLFFFVFFFTLASIDQITGIKPSKIWTVNCCGYQIIGSCWVGFIKYIEMQFPLTCSIFLHTEEEFMKNT
jgi:hypothetical protein